MNSKFKKSKHVETCQVNYFKGQQLTTRRDDFSNSMAGNRKKFTIREDGGGELTAKNWLVSYLVRGQLAIIVAKNDCKTCVCTRNKCRNVWLGRSCLPNWVATPQKQGELFASVVVLLLPIPHSTAALSLQGT
jgi:hypothetical protein